MKARSKSKVSLVGGIRRRQDGLTMTEVCCALAALTLLLMVALPALGMSKSRSHRIVCVNNLSRIGQATAMWANEHDGRRPMMTPYWEGGVQTSGTGIPPSPGGQSGWPFGPLNNQAWFHYFWLSNELVTPKVLFCPSETSPGRRPAVDWSVSPTTGLLHPNFRNNSVSYVVAHSTSDYERGLISADRNLPVIGNSASCGYGYFGIVVIAPTFLPLSWAGTLPLHYQEGNLLYTDGSVETADDVRLRAIFDAVTPSCSGTHFIAP